MKRPNLDCHISLQNALRILFETALQHQPRNGRAAILIPVKLVINLRGGANRERTLYVALYEDGPLVHLASLLTSCVHLPSVLKWQSGWKHWSNNALLWKTTGLERMIMSEITAAYKDLEGYAISHTTEMSQIPQLMKITRHEVDEDTINFMFAT